MEEFQYQQQLQSVGQAQLGAYANLSFGWEGRLMSQVINAPGSFSMISPFASARAAVGAGVMNPHLGSRLSSNDFFLRQAGLMSSIAGSTGTPEGFAMTALTGAHPRNPHMLGLEGGDSGMRSDLKGAIDGATIIIEMRMADGSVQRQRGTLRSPNNHVAGSSVSISESASRGGWVAGNVDR
jgi:hypothetical protein